MIQRIVNRATRVVGLVSDAGAALAALCIALIMTLVCVEVLGRTFFGVSTMIADEMSGYLNVAVVFLGLAYTLKENGFIRVEFVYQRFRGAVRSVARWIIVLTSLLYVLVIAVYMVRHVRYSYTRHILSTNVGEIPLWIPQSLIVAGVVILGLQILTYALNRVRNLP